MTHATNLVEQFRAATPSQRFELHAALVRDPDFGTGFANTLRDLVESVERAQADTRAARVRIITGGPPRSNVIPFMAAAGGGNA